MGDALRTFGRIQPTEYKAMATVQKVLLLYIAEQFVAANNEEHSSPEAPQSNRGQPTCLGSSANRPIDHKRSDE